MSIVRAVSIKGANRPSNFRCREKRSCDLIKKRLKQVMIASVDQRNPSWRAFQVIDELKTGKSSANHDQMMIVHCLHPF